MTGSAQRLKGLVLAALGASMLASYPTTAQQPLGVNLAFLSYHAQTLTFVDIFKASSPWIPHRPSDETWDTGEALDLDELGWVRSLQPDQEAGAVMMMEIGDAYPAGTYHVYYDGQGDLEFEWDALVVSHEPGHIVLDVTPQFGIHAVLRAIDPTDHLRNIRVYLPGFEDLGATQPFHPFYVDFLRPFSTLRFMDWAQTNELVAGEWSQRVTPQHATQGSEAGVALEYMIDLANTVGADPWFCVPPAATDEYIDSMATLIHDRLDPALTAYVEYGNENWNGQFAQYELMRQRGLALGLAGDDFTAALRYHSQRSVEIFTRFEAVFGSMDRLQRVLGGWFDDDLPTAQWLATELLDWQQAYVHVDAYAGGPYFGYYLGTPQFADTLATMTVDDVLDSAAADMRHVLDVVEQVRSVADARGVDFIAYEGGQHLAAVGEQMNNPAAVVLLRDANRHPRMYDLYTEFLSRWHQFGGLVNLYTDIRFYNDWGSFGLLERWDQDLATAHKFRAVTEFLQSPVTLQAINGSGSVAVEPSTPLDNAATTLSVGGSFPASNAAVSGHIVTISGADVTVDLTAAWTDGGSGPADGVVTPFVVAVDLGTLAAGGYSVTARVNGRTLATASMLVSQWLQAAHAPQSATLQPLGVNLAWLKDYSQRLTFVDIAKASREWISHRPSDFTWDSGVPLDLDTDGWVRSLQPDQEAGSLMMLALGDAYPAGQYTVLYDGQGVLDFEWDATVIHSEPGRMRLQVTPADGIHMVIRSTDPTDYIHNIRVIMPGFEDTYTTQPFHPSYVEFLRHFRLLRMKDLGEIDTAAPGSWPQRVRPTSATQASDRGVALEHIIELANAVEAEPWFCVPHTADDAYVDSMATMIRDRLDPSLSFHLEYSNEVWNGIYPQHWYARQRGMELGLHTSDDFIAALRFHAQRSVEIFQRFEAVFGNTDRFTRVIGGWQDDDIGFSTWLAESILDWHNAHASADAYGVSPYFGFFLGQPDFAAQLATMDVEAVLDSADADMQRVLSISQALVGVAGSRGLQLVAYEAGQHMVGADTQQGNPAVEALFVAANRHPRMEQIYADFLRGWPGASMALFDDIRFFGQYGSWGLLERWDQPLADAPKFHAVSDYVHGATAAKTATAVEGLSTLPGGSRLDGNFPNPFNSETTIRYHLATASAVRLDIYNAVGQKVRSLVAEQLPSGTYELSWDGLNDGGQLVSTGVYLLNLHTPSTSATRRMTLLK